MEPRTTNVRSPLSLGLSHHQQQQQQSLMGGQGGGGATNNLDYLGGGGNNAGRNSLDIPRSNDLRLSSPTPTANNDILSNNNNNGGSDHIMGGPPNGGAHQHQGLVPEESGQLTSPAQNNAVRTSQTLDSANNAAFMALRANPETTIRPLSSGLGSPEMPTNDLQGGVGGAPGGHDPQFSAASELINRYRLEQTINQLRGLHGFSADPRGPSGLTGLPFNQHNQV